MKFSIDIVVVLFYLSLFCGRMLATCELVQSHYMVLVQVSAFSVSLLPLAVVTE